jgi:hypothetical protein
MLEEGRVGKAAPWLCIVYLLDIRAMAISLLHYFSCLALMSSFEARISPKEPPKPTGLLESDLTQLYDKSISLASLEGIIECSYVEKGV